MGIENIMYFALGLLVSGLLALAIMPAVWQRAVRLTKKRIEAATPITMAEFRADKDQLRAEFALSTRRLEMNVEALRRRLADQMRDINRKKSELGGIKGERDNHLVVLRELEERESELRRRILELEKEGADLTLKLQIRDRENADRGSQLEAARKELQALANKPGETAANAGSEANNAVLTGLPLPQVGELVDKLDAERKRAALLDAQNRSLFQQLELAVKRSDGAAASAAELRASMARRDDEKAADVSDLIDAEARIADAESRMATLLRETTHAVETGEQKQAALSAEKLSLSVELDGLRQKVLHVESTLLADWQSDRIEQSHLRERLNDIASDVSRLVYAVDGHGVADAEESLFDRVQKFAEDGVELQNFPVRGVAPVRQSNPPLSSIADSGAVSDRLAALREIQGRS